MKRIILLFVCLITLVGYSQERPQSGGSGLVSPNDIISGTNSSLNLGVGTISGTFTGNGAGVTNLASAAVLGAQSQQWNPALQYVTNGTLGRLSGGNTAASSTFSGWGNGIGVVSNSFNALQMQVQAWNPALVPTVIAARLRNVGTFSTNCSTVPGGATNPGAWTIVAAATNSWVFGATTNHRPVTFDFGSRISTTSNLWLEVVADGRISVLTTTSTATNLATTPIPAYKTTASISDTDWVLNSVLSYSSQMFSEFLGTTTNYALSQNAISSSADALAIRLTGSQWNETRTVTTNYVVGPWPPVNFGPASSTFSGWGSGIGVVSNVFDSCVVTVNPYNTNVRPTTVVARLRYVGPQFTTNNVALIGATNPASWTVLAAATNSASSLTAQVNNTMVFNFAASIATTSNLWLEIVSDGYISTGIGSMAASGIYGPTIPIPAYLVNPTLSDTVWVAASGAWTYQPTVCFGRSLGVTGYDLTAGFLSKVNGGLGSIAVMPRISAAVSLPPSLYAVEGQEVNVYYSDVIRADLPLSDLAVQTTASLGTNYQNFFRTQPVAAKVGTNYFGLSVYYGDTNLVASYAGNWLVASNSAGTNVTRKVCIIGDSTSAGGQTITELTRMSGTNGFGLIGVGTQGSGTNMHEGRGGWTLAGYYNGNLSPFTNGAGVFSFAYYLTNNGITMASNDWVIVNLGINDIHGSSSDAAMASVISNWLTTFQAVYGSITNAVPGIRVAVGLVIAPSASQDSFGANYASGQTLARYRRNRFLFNEALITGTPAILLPINMVVDPVNNMLTTTGQLNARNTNSWTYQSNGVHPAQSGYLQIADQMWAFLKWHK